MIERIVKLIEEGKAKLNRILVLTFTNNSANDMKEKLYKKLSESSNKNCREALFEIAGANISNIHQFCKKLIQKYFFVCDVDPAFEVLSENESLVFKDKALDKTLEEFFFNKNDELDSFLESNFEKRNFDKIKQMILSVFTFLSILDEPKKWLEEKATKSYDDEANKNEGIKILCENAKFIFRHYLDEIDGLISHIKRFFQTSDFPSLFETRSKINEILTCDERGKLVDLILNLNLPKKNTSKNENVLAFYDENIEPLKKEFKEEYKKVKNSFGEESAEQISKFLQSNKASGGFLCELASEFIKKYAEIKKQKFLLDFDDLEAKAKLLLDDEKIREEVRSSFDFCFVDEYQDINILQEAIISSVSKKAFYFGVGDAKQAIYGFRLCSPEIFISKFENYKTEPEQNFAASLNKNYRSKINILRFVNKVFDVVMTNETAQIDYKNQARFQSDNDDEKSKVNLKIILNESGKDEEQTGVYSVKNHDFGSDEDDSIATLEAKQTVFEIKKLLEQNVAPKDIAILSRNRDSNSFIKKFYSYIQSAGLPIVANFRVNILSYPEISLVHNLMKLISNFKDDVVLFKVLSFPCFNFSVNELIEIRNEEAQNTFTDCFYNLAEKNAKIKKFVEFIEQERLVSQNVSVLNFAERLMHKLFEMGDSEFQNENAINHFEGYLNFISEINPSSLTDYCRLTQGEELQEALSNGENENAINFCTIHSSKGLEFKHVILIGAGKKLNLQNKDNVLIDESVGIGVKGFDEDEKKIKTPIYSAINIKTKRKNFAEEVRLLYVALTRAQESLTVIGSITEKTLEKLKTFNSDFDILKADNYLSLILQSFSAGELSKLKRENKTNLIYEKNEVGNCEIISKDDVLSYDLSSLKSKENKCNVDINKANQNFNSIVNVENVYLKNNVSAVVKSLNDEINYSVSVYGDGNKTSNVIGTKYHEEFAKFNFDSSDLKLKHDENLDEKFLNMFLENDLYNFCQNKKVEKELPFLFYDLLPEKFGFGKNKVLLQGVIDLIVLEEDGFVVVDYKASHASDEKLVNRYKYQLELYAYCAEKILNKACKKKIIYKIFDGKMLEIL